ncbi:MAG: hypothetical protein J6L69_10270 [Lachnospiraceae bacterium]|nr:hypothetical protein [Lachnospiraceae bacterium]
MNINSNLTNFSINAYSLVISANLTTNNTTYTLYDERKFSDYDFITITIGASTSDIRAEMTLPRSVFTSGKQLFLDCHSNNGNTWHQVAVKYASDKTITAFTSTGATVKYLNIYGYKKMY